MFILGKFVKFESVTLVPYEPKLIDFTMMNPPQIKWYNDYNQLIRNKLLPRLQNIEDKNTVNWILTRTNHVSPWIGLKTEL